MPQKRHDDNFKYIEKRTFCNFFCCGFGTGKYYLYVKEIEHNEDNFPKNPCLHSHQLPSA